MVGGKFVFFAVKDTTDNLFEEKLNDIFPEVALRGPNSLKIEYFIMRVFMLKRNSASVAHSIVSMYFLQMKLCLCIQGLLVHDNHLPSLGVTKILI